MYFLRDSIPLRESFLNVLDNFITGIYDIGKELFTSRNSDIEYLDKINKNFINIIKYQIILKTK